MSRLGRGRVLLTKKEQMNGQSEWEFRGKGLLAIESFSVQADREQIGSRVEHAISMQVIQAVREYHGRGSFHEFYGYLDFDRSGMLLSGESGVLCLVYFI